MVGVGPVRAVPCHAMPCRAMLCCATWAGAGLSGSAEPVWCGGMLLVWVAEQEEKKEMSSSEKEAVEEFWGR